MSAGIENRLPSLQHARRIVVKIGSSLLIDAETGTLNTARLNTICAEVHRLQTRGQQVLIVSSGAIALGRRQLDLSRNQRRLDYHQSAAAAGQVLLIRAYHEVFDRYQVKIAQILLTLDDTEHRKRYLNARATLENLLELGAMPIVNENDSVATDEIRYGDNDRLAARVALMISADCLILLSDVAGLYDADPEVDENARLIPIVESLDAKIDAVAGESRTEFGSGGMVTKVAAAKICIPSGCATVIASGLVENPLANIEDGGPCTWFVPKTTPQAARKQWIAGTLTPKGSLHIDAGAMDALLRGRSLLAVGITAISGEFDRGDPVTIHGPDRVELARGLVAYSSQESELIKGKHSDTTEEILGYCGRKAVVHRDDMVLL